MSAASSWRDSSGSATGASVRAMRRAGLVWKRPSSPARHDRHSAHRRRLPVVPHADHAPQDARYLRSERQGASPGIGRQGAAPRSCAVGGASRQSCANHARHSMPPRMAKQTTDEERRIVAGQCVRMTTRAWSAGTANTGHECGVWLGVWRARATEYGMCRYPVPEFVALRPTPYSVLSTLTPSPDKYPLCIRGIWHSIRGTSFT